MFPRPRKEQKDLWHVLDCIESKYKTNRKQKQSITERTFIMANARVEILHETMQKTCDEGWALCFQQCKYHYDNGQIQAGYRFIWRRPDGTLQAARGQARIPSVAVMLKLVSTAMSEGWGCLDGDATGYEFPETDKMD